jgi:hypothetical protein
VSLSTPLEGPITLVLALAVGLLLLLALIGKLSDLRLKRDGEAVAVKGLIADALDRDPELLGLPFSAAVRVPLLRGKPVVIRISGEVPSDELKRVALRRVQHTAKAELLVRVRIRSRIGIAPAATLLRRARSR